MLNGTTLKIQHRKWGPVIEYIHLIDLCLFFRNSIESTTLPQILVTYIHAYYIIHIIIWIFFFLIWHALCIVLFFSRVLQIIEIAYPVPIILYCYNGHQKMLSKKFYCIGLFFHVLFYFFLVVIGLIDWYYVSSCG